MRAIAITPIQKNRFLLFAIIFSLVTGLSLLAANIQMFSQDAKWLVNGLIADFAITIPLIYWIFAKKAKLPRISTVSLLVLGLLWLSYLLPQNYSSLLAMIISVGLPLLELTIISVVIWKVTAVIRVAKRKKNSVANIDFIDLMKQTCAEVLGNQTAGNALGSEISVVYYAIFGWKKTANQQAQFTYHKKSGLGVTIWVLSLVVLAESIATHLFLSRYTEVGAWVATFLSVYSMVFLFAYLNSCKARFIELRESSILLRDGILNEVEIPYANIEKVEVAFRDLPEQDGIDVLKLSPLTSHNMILTLKEPQKATGIYGIRKNFSVLGLRVDEKDQFAQQLQEAVEMP